MAGHAEQWLLQMDADPGGMLETFKQVIAQARQMNSELGDTAGSKKATKDLDRLDAQLDELAASLKATGSAGQAAKQGVDKVAKASGDAAKPMAGVSTAADQLGSRLGDVGVGAGEAGQAISGLLTGSLGPLAAGMMAATAAVSIGISKLNEWDEKTRRMNANMIESVNLLAQMTEGVRGYFNEIASRRDGADLSDPEIIQAAVHLQETGLISDTAEAGRVAGELLAAGIDPQSEQAAWYARAVGTGQAKVGDLRRFKARYSRDPAAMKQSLQAKYEARRQTYAGLLAPATALKVSLQEELAEDPLARFRASGEAAAATEEQKRLYQRAIGEWGWSEDVGGRLKSGSGTDYIRQAQESPFVQRLSAAAGVELGLNPNPGEGESRITINYIGQQANVTHQNRDPSLGGEVRGGFEE